MCVYVLGKCCECVYVCRGISVCVDGGVFWDIDNWSVFCSIDNWVCSGVLISGCFGVLINWVYLG